MRFFLYVIAWVFSLPLALMAFDAYAEGSKVGAVFAFGLALFLPMFGFLIGSGLERSAR